MYPALTDISATDDKLTRTVFEVKWQPIETAPRDGTEFLAYDSATGKMDVCTMEQPFPGKEHWVCYQVQMDGESGPLSDEFGTSRESIRHWMPLPDRP